MEGLGLEVRRLEKERPRSGLGGGHGVGRRGHREGESGGDSGLQVGAASSSGQKGTAGRTHVPEADRPGFKSQHCHLLAM